MVNIGSNNNKIAYGIKHFNIDELSDLNSIAVGPLTPGSTVFVISTSKYYMLNGSKKWIEVNPYGIGNSGGGGGGSSNPSYDGGSIDGTDPT